jgi:hypothetical protein
MARSLQLEALGVILKLELARRPQGAVEAPADNLSEGDYPSWSAAQVDAGGHDALSKLERTIAATRARVTGCVTSAMSDCAALN